MTRTTVDELVFFVNGKKVVEKNADPETTLLVYLRRKLGLCGTKLGCGEGGCGACTVMISKYDRLQNKIVHFSVNACLTPICSLHHVAVTTVEGIGNTKKLHPVQERIAKSHGSQCGFCTPGIVMSMYTLLRNKPEPTVEEIENAFQGNLCRCTGYRPILQGFRTFAKDGGCCGGSGNNPNCCMSQTKDQTIAPSSSLFNPEDFKPLDPTQEPIFPPELLRLKDTPRKTLRFEGERVTWIQVSTMEELLDLKAQHPDAKLVVGNTEIGIEMKFKNMLFPLIICPAWILELTSVAHGPEGISFGAACPLSLVESVLADAIATLPEQRTEVFRGVMEQLRWFAGKQVKSVASIGGNIITASPISDLNPVLMASRAKLTLASRGTKRTVWMDHTFFPGYRRTLLSPEEILVSIVIPYSRKGEFFSAFKQASRREDDIAKVTSGMRVLFKPGTTEVQELSLCFGGMADRTVSALKTTPKQLSKSWNEELLQDVCAGLAEELHLAPDAPGGMVEFRRTLTLSFFFKFYLTVLQKLGRADLEGMCGKLDPTFASATLLFQKDPPANVQLFQEVPKGQSEEDMVGRPMPHLAADMQASGEAVYCDDIPRYENELSLRLVTSTRAHAKIMSIDTSEAKKVPGFVCFLTSEDVPGSNITGIFNDETVFAKDEVTCVGHIIGAVVADTPEHAHRAARGVKITYEDLPAIITIQDAIKNNSFYGPEVKIEKGDLKKGFSEADNVVSGELYIGGQEHFYLETHCTIAVPKGEAGEMELFVSTQNTMKTQSFIAKMLGVPDNRIVVRVKRMGGGFGGKETRSTLISTAVALAAYKTGRPVRCMLDRDEDMLITGGRHPFLAKYKVGFMKTGTIVALEVAHFSNGGNSEDLSRSIMERAVFHMDNAYKIPNIRGTGRICKTNLPSNTAFRGFGGPQGMLIAEYWMSEVAVTCGLPAEEVRRKNMYKEGDLTHFNQKLEGFTLPRCWDECIASSQYQARKMEVEKFNRENCWKKRGLCIIPTKFGISFTLSFLNQGGALVHVYTDGSVLLTHGGTEMGQGLHTKMVQVASRALKIPTSKIHITETSTNTVPNTSPTAASASADLNGQAIYEACQTILKRLEPFKKKNPSGSWESWVMDAYTSAVSLSATGFYKTPNLGYSFETNSGNPFHYFSYGVACSEVEIDCLTGDHKNLRTDIVMDVGSSLNPAIDIGQVEGAFVQGLGLFTMEELHYSPEGSLHTRGPSTYKIPAFGSIPIEFRVSLLRDCPNKRAIYASKVYACQHCQVAKNTVIVAPQQHLPMVGNPWSVVTVDLMGPFHTSNRSHVYAIIMTDLFTKWVMILPLCDVSASEISKAIINIFFLYGPPQKIIMDQRDEFIEQINVELYRLFGAKEIVISRASGSVNPAENTPSTIKTFLSKHCADHPNSWDEHLPALSFAFNVTHLEPNKNTPYFQMFNRNPCVLECPPEEGSEGTSVFARIVAAIREADGVVENKTPASSQMENNNSDELSKSKVVKKKAKQLNPFHLKVGHEVLRQRKNWWKDGRFQSEWVGPCVIDYITESGCAVLRDNTGTRLKRPIKMSHLRPYVRESSEQDSLYLLQGSIVADHDYIGLPEIPVGTYQANILVEDATIGIADNELLISSKDHELLEYRNSKISALVEDHSSLEKQTFSLLDSSNQVLEYLS